LGRLGDDFGRLGDDFGRLTQRSKATTTPCTLGALGGDAFKTMVVGLLCLITCFKCCSHLACACYLNVLLVI
jgi:hypothetical protein